MLRRAPTHAWLALALQMLQRVHEAVEESPALVGTPSDVQQRRQASPPAAAALSSRPSPPTLPAGAPPPAPPSPSVPPPGSREALGQPAHAPDGDACFLPPVRVLRCAQLGALRASLMCVPVYQAGFVRGIACLK